jgi:8-oxo-dGTP pyrophosphatase MutT (NUDIX family)
MKRFPWVSVILENGKGEVLLLLRENSLTNPYPNHWTLIGSAVEAGETPEMAAQRSLREETGLQVDLSLWKRYDRQHPLFIVDQHIYTGKTDASRDPLDLEEKPALQFFQPEDILRLKIGYGFKAILREYLDFGR